MSRQRRSGVQEHGRLPLAGRAVMVIGTAGSLAPRLAREAGERGAHVALATTEAPGEDDAGGCTILTSTFDSEVAIDRLYDLVIERLSRLDVVIVVLQAHALDDLHTLSLDRWRRQIAEPLRTTFWLAQRTLDEFVGSGRGGRLVFVIDRLAPGTGEALGVLAEGVASLARSLAREYGRQAVSCHLVVQAGSADAASHDGDRHRPVVECTLFLASRAASFMTGESVIVGNPVTRQNRSTSPA